MNDYVENTIHTLPQKLKRTDMSIKPDGNNLFENGNDNPLGKSPAGYFHMMVANALFLSKRAKPDI